MTSRTRALPNWPVIVALGLVTLLIVAIVGFDLYLSEQEAVQTTDIIENAQKSVILLDSIRIRAKRLAMANDPLEVERLRREILTYGLDYEPIATYPGERKAWQTLQQLLKKLPIDRLTQAAAAHALDADIDRSIDTLVAINTAAGRGNLAAIRATHRRALWNDAVAGGVVLAIVVLISVWLLRVLSRQRRLILDQVRFLDEKNAELEAFAGRAAHDLRSPMNPIRGYADLILETPTLPENVSAMAQRIRRSVDRMARVVDDMLALSTSGRPAEGQCASRVVVERILEEMGAELQGVEVVTTLQSGQVVACAEGTLSQILRNLITNAIKFRSRARPLRIAIETREVGRMVEIAVEDNGMGMDPNSAKHVFEPFYRGPLDREVPGHGLGLAIVERMTRAMGGSCEVSSVVDRYTRIVVRLPLV
jgi:signal transduction histidine kinase